MAKEFENKLAPIDDKLPTMGLRGLREVWGALYNWRTIVFGAMESGEIAADSQGLLRYRFEQNIKLSGKVREFATVTELAEFRLEEIVATGNRARFFGGSNE